MKRVLYIFSDGELKREGNTLILVTDEGKKVMPVETVEALCVFSEVSLNKRFLEFSTKKKVVLHFFNHYGYYVGSYYPR